MRGAALTLFAVINEEQKRNDYAIEVPKALSLILKHDVNAEIKGLNDFRDQHPPVFAVFWSFRVMVGMGVLMLLTSWTGWWLYRRSGWHPLEPGARRQPPRPAAW